MSEEAAVPVPDPASAGERIERLLEASDAGGPVARARAEELVRLVADLYGAGLERLLEVLYDAGALTDEALDAVADDELVSGLLLVHGLHPYPLEDRIARALDRVRPYLGSHGGDVEVDSITPEGVVLLRMLGSCDGCASSAMTLQLAVEGAITAAAPEVTGIEVAAAPTSAAATIPAEALTARLHPRGADAGAAWMPLGDVELVAGRAAGGSVAGADIVVMRVGSASYAYQAQCPSCHQSLAGGPVERRLGADVGTAVLTCPHCRAHYDVRNAGRGLDETGAQLIPVPLLERDGGIEVAVTVPAEPAGVTA